jgi:hypothetical protein
VCLQETKLELVSKGVVPSLWGCHHANWYFLGYRGDSGRVLLMWDRRVMEKIEECGGIFCCLLFKKCQQRFQVGFCGWIRAKC